MLKSVLNQDVAVNGVNFNSIFSKVKFYLLNPSWRFIDKRSKYEHYANSNNLFCKIYAKYLFISYKREGLHLGFSIPPFLSGQGLSLLHYGTLVISKLARIGKNAGIHVCVNIGAHEEFAPIIGDNVYIASGVKMYGKIVIGNNVKIAANSVVNKSLPEDNVVIGGMPVKVLKKLNDNV